jgi:L-malate glycosyltransferase
MVSQRMPPHVAGAELQALGLARALRAHDVDVRVLTTRHLPGLERRAESSGVSVRRIRTLRPGRIPQPAVDASRAGAMALAVARAAMQSDIVHLHCISASSLGAIVGAHSANVPVVLKPSLGGEDGELAKVLRSPSRPFALRALRRVERFASIDPQITEELLTIGIDPERIIPTDNGIDRDRFHPPTIDRNSERAAIGLPYAPLVLFAGQVIERKGVGVLAEAWPRVRASLPSARLVIAGVGEPHLMRELERSGAIMLGARDDVEVLMRSADALVFPSTNESFGNVLLEAAASGLPVICGPTGIARRVHLHERLGVIVDPTEPHALAGGIIRALNDDDLARRAEVDGPEMAANFDMNVVARQYLDVYRSIRTDPVWAPA